MSDSGFDLTPESVLSEERQKPLSDSRFDLLTFSTDLDLLAFVPRIEQIVRLVEKYVLARNPLDRETT